MMPVVILPPAACPVPPDIGAISSRVSRMSDVFISPDREARTSEACAQQRSQDSGGLRAKLDGLKTQKDRTRLGRPVERR
jgi:hypothetical protein